MFVFGDYKAFSKIYTTDYQCFRNITVRK